MNILSLGWAACLLLPVGMGLALLGFWLEDPAPRICLQVLGLLMLCVAVGLGQSLLKPLADDVQ